VLENRYIFLSPFISIKYDLSILFEPLQANLQMSARRNIAEKMFHWVLLQYRQKLYRNMDSIININLKKQAIFK